jgi:hypothetical protein
MAETRKTACGSDIFSFSALSVPGEAKTFILCFLLFFSFY